MSDAYDKFQTKMLQMHTANVRRAALNDLQEIADRRMHENTRSVGDTLELEIIPELKELWGL
jgi:hypothetical protein